MFRCKICEEKDKVIKILTEQNKELHDRVMAFNERAFVTFQAEKKQGKPLFPIGIDAQGKPFNYKDTDLNTMRDETFRAFGEEPIEVEEDK